MCFASAGRLGSAVCPAQAGQAGKQSASSTAELSVNWLQRAGC